MKIFNLFKKKKTNITDKLSITFSGAELLDINNIEKGIPTIINQSITEISVDDNNTVNKVAVCIGTDHKKFMKVQDILNGSERYNYEKTGEVVKAKSDGQIGVILKIDNYTGQVIVMLQIHPMVQCIYDDYSMLQKINSFSQLNETIIRDIPS